MAERQNGGDQFENYPVEESTRFAVSSHPPAAPSLLQIALPPSLCLRIPHRGAYVVVNICVPPVGIVACTGQTGICKTGCAPSDWRNTLVNRGQVLERKCGPNSRSTAWKEAKCENCDEKGEKPWLSKCKVSLCLFKLCNLLLALTKSQLSVFAAGTRTMHRLHWN